MTLASQEAAPRTYTVTQLAEILQLRPATVRANARNGTWPHLILTKSEVEPPAPQTMRRRTRRPTM